MLRVEYSREASNYFLDNGRLTFDLMVAIEGLVFTNGIPSEGRHVEPIAGAHVWTYMGHLIAYHIEGNRLIVQAVAPVI